MPNSTQDYAIHQMIRALHFEVQANEGADIATAVSELLSHARALHRATDTHDLGPVTELRMAVNRRDRVHRGGTMIASIWTLREMIHGAERDGLIVHVLREGYSFELGRVDATPAEGTVRYLIEPYVEETVVTPGGAHEIEQVPDQVSPLAETYFRDLDRALDDYYVHRARASSCHYLEEAWFDEARIALANQPEVYMRRSLHDYLSTRLRDAEPDALQEQNVNETEPVDVRIQWLDSRRISLLEVKWLGDSVSADGTRISTPYRDGRATDGYKQAADYLEEQRVTSPGRIVHSRLIVFDGRRKGVRISDGAVTCEDGWAYRSSEIDYSSVEREDPGIEIPRRFFLEPNLPRVA